MKKALVISGGGAKGAWGGGIAEALYRIKNKDWDSYYGCSTGSLLITLSALKEFDRLKEAYTSVTNKDIFSVNPFTKKGKIKICNAIWRILRGKTSLGEAENLKQKIYDIFSEQQYKKVLENKKITCCTVTNYRTGRVEYKYNNDHTYDEYVNYTYASTSVPIAFDFVKTDSGDYLDGGVMDHVPIQQAIKDGADEIDVIILRPEIFPIENWKGKNILDVFMRTIDLMQTEVSESDVLIGKLMAEKKVVLNLYFTPRVLTTNSLMFDKKQMTEWWNEAYDSIKNSPDNLPKQSFVFKKGKFERI